ncbi:hypothetical protein AA0112_g10885 [Alternaria arborescens]|nr:hypothetical protein AA0112_g10885 [Alternaria arborescens]
MQIWKLPASDDYSLWSYDTESMSWARYDLTYAVPRRPNWGANAEAWRLGLAFYLNGMVDKGSSIAAYTVTEYINGTLQNETADHITYLPGLNIINMTTQVARNVGTDSLGAPRIAGGLVWGSRIGKSGNGTLVAMGGMRSAGQRIDTFSNGVLVDFATVALCDTFHETDVRWYNQSTTGEIPPPRIDFCTMPSISYAKDNSSSNIYIYGGYDPVQAIMYDDVYVLSLPSFIWTKVYSGNDSRFGHSCHSAGVRHMIRIGGSLDADTYAFETTGQLPVLDTIRCDQQGGVALFDLSDCTWGSFYDTNAPGYEVPTKLVERIGGTAGGATVVEPVSGYDHPAISVMFNRPAATSSLSDLSVHPDGIKSSHIAGAVVGAVGGSFILAILLVWAIKWRRKTLHAAKPDTAIAQEKEDDFSITQELPAKSMRVELDEQRYIAELDGETGSFDTAM